MKVYPANGPFHLVETDIVEPLEARAGNSAYSMIRDEEVLFPPHEDVLPVGEVAVGEVWPLGLLRQGTPGREAGPVVHISLLRGSPCIVPGLEGVFGSDDLSFEECRQGGMILREAYTSRRLELRSQVTTWNTDLVYGGSRRGRTQPCRRV